MPICDRIPAQVAIGAVLQCIVCVFMFRKNRLPLLDRTVRLDVNYEYS